MNLTEIRSELSALRHWRHLRRYSDLSAESILAWAPDGPPIQRIGDCLWIQVDYGGPEPNNIIVPGADTDLVIEQFRQQGIEAIGPLPRPAAKILARRVDLRLSAAVEHHDYVLDLSRHLSMHGSDYTSLRKSRSRFARRYPEVLESTTLTDLRSMDLRDEIVRLAGRGAGDDRAFGDYELRALTNLMADSLAVENLRVFQARDGQRLVAFALIGQEDKRWATAHFWKSRRDYPDLQQHLLWAVCRGIARTGTRYLNLEQDLSIAGLRQFKRSLRPRLLLRKYWAELL
ncbi:MAG: phosphatidylglycerol lysyltransferase domain-containing protein [Actinomycetota bacterium]